MSERPALPLVCRDHGSVRKANSMVRVWTNGDLESEFVKFECDKCDASLFYMGEPEGWQLRETSDAGAGS